MNYAVYTTEPFDKEIEKLEKSQKERIENLYPKLAHNPMLETNYNINI